MTLRKLIADYQDRAHAYTAGNALENFVEPAPDALTVFELGPAQWRVEAYFEDYDEQRDLNGELAQILGPGATPFVAEDIPDLNWVAVSQAALPPVIAGRFIVHGSHDRRRVGRGPNTILIDAGEAFGTAHHATTLGCLLAIDRLTRSLDFDRVLDLGCGSGVLAIALAKADPHARIIATDLDRQSVKVAASNIRLNGVAGRVHTAIASGVDHPWLRTTRFDLIIANILAGPLIQLAPRLARTIERGGRLVLSGLLIRQAPAVIATYLSAGFQLERHDRITGWSTLTLRRR